MDYLMAQSEADPSGLIGKKAPAFSLLDQAGRIHKLSDFKSASGWSCSRNRRMARRVLTTHMKKTNDSLSPHAGRPWIVLPGIQNRGLVPS